MTRRCSRWFTEGDTNFDTSPPSVAISRTKVPETNWNWSLGGRYAMGPIEAGLRYVDTDLRAIPGRRSGAGVVASLGVRF